MTKNRWQLQEAKSRFSELVENALKQGAQTVTKHGRPAVVVISVEEYERSRAPRKSLVDALRACPEDLTDLVGRRPKRMARKVDFG
ncbi:MAG: type II toxin-antitoxin system Phd/YefM family antitoxin [Verrucomicrobiales bacterium]|nr:type II toxin-antitoxin system Phd/YefM family antitoxin [Verrucomicrobiales bacterium]